jgi:hypothetical protein
MSCGMAVLKRVMKSRYWSREQVIAHPEHNTAYAPNEDTANTNNTLIFKLAKT